MTILNLRTATGFALFCILGAGMVLEKDGSAHAPAVHGVTPGLLAARPAGLPAPAGPDLPADVAGAPAGPSLPDAGSPAAGPQAGGAGYRGQSAPAPADPQNQAALAEDLRLALH